MLEKILKKYLEIFPNEQEKTYKLQEINSKQDYKQITDWNNFEGHIVASGFVIDSTNKKVLLLYHRDFKYYVYPGGHIDREDRNIIDAAKREVLEETGLKAVEQIITGDSPLIPFDIDIHLIPYNDKLNLPEHFHFDFRYLFKASSKEAITVQQGEIENYKWVDIEDKYLNEQFKDAVSKIKKIMQNC